MDTTSLFTAALQLPDPWRVSGVEFRDEEDGRRELHIAIGFAAGSRFPCPEPGCGEAACPVHDARERVWRHLNFFQYKAFIHAGVPRVTCPAHGVHAVPVPWARPGSGFTLLFEAMVVELAKSQPVADIAEQVGEHDCISSSRCFVFSHDDFSGLGRACRPRNGLNWMVLVSPPERTGKDYDQHAPSTVYPSFAAERGIRRVDRAENTCQRADGA